MKVKIVKKDKSVFIKGGFLWQSQPKEMSDEVLHEHFEQVRPAKARVVLLSMFYYPEGVDVVKTNISGMLRYFDKGRQCWMLSLFLIFKFDYTKFEKIAKELKKAGFQRAI